MRFPKAYLEASSRSKDQDLKSYRKLVSASGSESTIEDALDTNVVNTLSQGEEVMDAEKDQSLLTSLDYETWLPFAAKVYKISPRIEDYILVNTPICPSELPNRNGIAFPTSELARFMPPPTNRMAYKAWKSCPLHLEHANEIHEDAYGVILDTSFHKVSGYGNGKLRKVRGLIA